MVAIFLMSFTCISGNGGRTQGMQTQKGLRQFLFHENGSYLGSWVLPDLILGRLLHLPEEGPAIVPVLPFKRYLVPLLEQFVEKMTLTHQSHIVTIQNSPERGRCGRPAKAC